jgi:hypothetical protein
MAELDSTYALLSSNLPVGGDPNSVKIKPKSAKKTPNSSPNKISPGKIYVDSEEEEIFFGDQSEKEVNGRDSK